MTTQFLIFTTIKFSFNDLWNRTLSLISADFVHDGVYTCQVRLFIIHLLFGVIIYMLFGIIIPHMLFGIIIPLLFGIIVHLLIGIILPHMLFGVILDLLFDYNSNVSGEDEDGWSDPEKRGAGESDR